MGVIFLHSLQTNEVDRKWMATFGRERPGAMGAAVAAQAGGTHSQARLLSSAEDRRQIGLEKESCREGRVVCGRVYAAVGPGHIWTSLGLGFPSGR